MKIEELLSFRDGTIFEYKNILEPDYEYIGIIFNKKYIILKHKLLKYNGSIENIINLGFFEFKVRKIE